jgi:putative transposase
MHAAGATPAELCRQHGISETTLYNWKARDGGMRVSDAKRLKGLKEENRRLERLHAEAHLDFAALKGIAAGKF